MNKIMSGEYSKDMWESINTAKTKRDLRWALYFVCCRLQELESRMYRVPQTAWKYCPHCGNRLEVNDG